MNSVLCQMDAVLCETNFLLCRKNTGPIGMNTVLCQMNVVLFMKNSILCRMNPNRYNHCVRVDLGVMSMKMYPVFPKVLGMDLTIRWFIIISRTLVKGGRDSVSVFYNRS